MLKQIIIFAIAACFFLENIVVYAVLKSNATYCEGDSDENDNSENGDSAKKDKKEEYKISSTYKYFFLSDTLNNRFYFFAEQVYSEYCPEINQPPPDLA